MTDEKLYETMTEIFSDVFGRDIQLRPEMTAKDVEGWDSLKFIEIIVALEQHFGIKFHTREIDGLHSIGDLVRLLSGKT